VGFSSTPFQPYRRKTAFTGQTFVFTGTLSKFSRDEAQALVEKYGGQAASSVSKKTNYVVIGENAGSKAETARRLGVKSSVNLNS
jgi:DNA ligase (NAD+)